MDAKAAKQVAFRFHLIQQFLLAGEKGPKQKHRDNRPSQKCPLNQLDRQALYLAISGNPLGIC